MLKSFMKCDLHIHTFYSYDCNSSPQEMIDAALEKGINCLAITDHGETAGVKEAMEYSADKSILIIPGIEIKTKEGDILGLNIKESIPDGLSAKETVRRIKERGGMVIMPHPFGWIYSFKGNLKEIVQDIDGIEVLNASIFGPGNKKALDFAKKYNLPYTAGSDAHSPAFVGKVFLEIVGENLSIEEVLENIKEGKGKIDGKEADFFEKVVEHTMSNVAKIFYYAGRKKRKI